MYLTNIKIENIGPIGQLNLEIQAPKDRAPLPLVFVGTNGSGKSLVLGQIASALINAHGSAYDDSPVEKGRVFKLRDLSYIRHGQNYSFSDLRFTHDIFEREIVLDRNKEKFEREIRKLPIEDWDKLKARENSGLFRNFEISKVDVRRALVGPHIYFPPNRFEEPAWINHLNLKDKLEFPNLRRYNNISNRNVIEYAPLKDNQSWLLELFVDSYALERKINKSDSNNPYFHHAGSATTLLNHIRNFIVLILGETDTAIWNLGERSSRTIGLSASGKTLFTNLFSLSTGQSLVLDIFFTILRQADWSMPQIDKLEEIEGLVVIDEVDLHLHTEFQFKILPKLFSIFPKIQFILSSHSPLFLLGLEKELGESGSTIVELPSGSCISAERFSEFESAYDQIAMTRKYEIDLNKRVKESVKPLLFLEGDTDELYIKRAAELLNMTGLLSKFDIQLGNGVGNLNKIWKTLKYSQGKGLAQPVILLYDCDQNKPDIDRGSIFQRTIPLQKTPIESGIENLFPKDTIDRILEHKKKFIDSVNVKNRIRGRTILVPEKLSVNPDEKSNMCDWICKNGSDKDFKHFVSVFVILRGCLSALPK